MRRRYGFVRQADQTDCGAASLAMIALHHRIPIGLQAMRDLAGTDRSGSNLLGLLRAAEAIGLTARGIKGPYDALSRVPLPAIAHVNTEEGLGHFVVLYRVKKNAVVVADPAHGVRTLSRDDFCGRWTGHLLLVVPRDGVAPAHRRAPAAPWRRFLDLLVPHTPELAEALVCALILSVLGVAISYFIQHLVDTVLVRHEARLLNALAFGMVLIIVFRTLFSALRQYLLAFVGRKVDLTLLAGYARHVLGLPLRFFETRRVGEILSRTSDAAKVRDAVSGTTTTAVMDAVLVVLLLGVLWLYDGPLALVATAFVPLLILGVAAHHPALKRQSLRAMEHSSQLMAHLVEDIAGVETVKAFGIERARADEGEVRLLDFVESVFSVQMLGLSTDTLGMVVTALAGVAILWQGGHRVLDGALTVGQLMFFYSLLGSMLEPLQRLSSVSLKLQEALVAIDRLGQILDLEAEPRGDARSVAFAGVREGVELRGVGFRYGHGAGVLEGLDLRIPAGQTVAIVGESGGGKSTLLKLLMGFYAPTQGQVLIDGVDMRDYDLATLRDRVGLVAQDPFIFNGTLAENIALGRPGTSRGAIIAAARAAGLDEFIAALPERYETLIGERGSNLSGGQRQRLAIARALLRSPEMLIFDEATSHLDTATERAIQGSLRTALAGKTVVLVAHRLSTIKDADLIYVLHRGRVVESGSHRQLLAREGPYWSLWRAQAEDGERAHVRPPAAASRGNGVVRGEGASHA